MRQLFSRLLVVALLVLACSGAVWGDNLTVRITKRNGAERTETGQESMEKALEGYKKYDALHLIGGIVVSAGDLKEADWTWLQNNRENLSGLGYFEVRGDIGSVANIPNTTEDSPYFSTHLYRLLIDKLKRVGNNALQNCKSLESVSLPDATEIGDNAFKDCGGLKSLQLGATQPSVGRDAFLGCPLVRSLELLNADGIPLTGGDLTNAKSKYKAVDDGDTEDNLWYGWAFEDTPASNLSGSIDGEPFSSKASLQEAMQGKELDKVKELTITGGSFQVADWAFLLEQGQGQARLAIETFTIESGVERVADMPDLPYGSPRYLPKVQKVIIAKMRKMVNYAFNGCTSLTSVSLQKATVIGDEAFNGCTSLKSISLPAATEIGEDAFQSCTNLKSVSLPVATKIGNNAFKSCTNLKSVSLPAAKEIGYLAFNGCWLGKLQLGAEPPLVRSYTFDDYPKSRTLLIIDAAGVPLVGDALATAADKYDRDEGKPNDKKWYGWTIQMDPPRMGTVKITPADCGTVRITRKDGGEVVNFGNGLKNGETLIVTATPKSGYKYNKNTTAEGAKDNGNNEWEVTAESGEVVFTVEIEADGGSITPTVLTLGATTITPAGAGEVTITRKDGGAVVNPSDELKNGEILIVTATPKSEYNYKKTTAVGAKDNGNNEWEVTATSGKVIFTVEFEKAPEENSNNDPTPVESVLLAQVQLSPNPTDGQVTINAGTTLARCEVYTSTGALLQAIESPESVFSIDLTASPSGVYLVRLVDMQGGCKTLRVVKQ